jgi:hypothetical protein
MKIPGTRERQATGHNFDCVDYAKSAAHRLKFTQPLCKASNVAWSSCEIGEPPCSQFAPSPLQLQLCGHPFADRDADDRESARRPAGHTDVSEAEKVEGFRTSLPARVPSFGGKAPKFDQARFSALDGKELPTDCRASSRPYQAASVRGRPRSVVPRRAKFFGVIAEVGDQALLFRFAPLRPRLRVLGRARNEVRGSA